jgi:hypothetical protein
MKEIRLQEARISMEFLINSIRQTRDKSWQLFGIIIAIEAYFSQALLNSNCSANQLLMFILTSILCVVIAMVGNKAIFPNGLRAQGIEPNNSSDMKSIDILHTYQIGINENAKVLSDQVKAFKRSVYIFYGYLILSFFGILCSKCLIC